MNPYIEMDANKHDTATKKLVDFLDEARKLGLEKINTYELITHVRLLGKLEENLLKQSFMDGREYQDFEDSGETDWDDNKVADKYFLDNFVRYI
jgi:carbamoylphosphate synthase small subunit